MLLLLNFELKVRVSFHLSCEFFVDGAFALACLVEAGLGADDGLIEEINGEASGSGGGGLVSHDFSFLCSWHLAVVWEPPLF